jgi:hypothetical protein
VIELLTSEFIELDEATDELVVTDEAELLRGDKFKIVVLVIIGSALS